MAGVFFYDVLMGFAAIAQAKNDKSFAEHCRSEAARLREKIEQSGWDGRWYRRAYFDDGSPLGSAGTRNAGLIQSRRAGPFCPVPGMPPERAWQWKRWMNTLSAGSMPLSSSWILPSTHRI